MANTISFGPKFKRNLINATSNYLCAKFNFSDLENRHYLESANDLDYDADAEPIVIPSIYLPPSSHTMQCNQDNINDQRSNGSPIRRIPPARNDPENDIQRGGMLINDEDGKTPELDGDLIPSPSPPWDVFPPRDDRRNDGRDPSDDDP